MAGQGLLQRTFQTFTSTRFLLNNRPSVQLTQAHGVKQETLQRLKDLNIPEKPKRPLTAYFKFLLVHRPLVQKDFPSLKLIPLAKKCALDWKALEPQQKQRYENEYKLEQDAFKRKLLDYEAKLTPEQVAALEDYKKEAAGDKAKRQERAKRREHNKPKRPPTSYMLFIGDEAKRHPDRSYKQLLSELKEKWAQLPPVDKIKYTERWASAQQEYERELRAWEAAMLAQGNDDLVRHKTLEEERPATARKPKKK